MIQPKRCRVVVVPKRKYTAIRFQQGHCAGERLARRCQRTVQCGGEKLKLRIRNCRESIDQRTLGCRWLKEIRVLEKRHEPRLALAQAFIRQEEETPILLYRTT